MQRLAMTLSSFFLILKKKISNEIAALFKKTVNKMLKSK